MEREIGKSETNNYKRHKPTNTHVILDQGWQPYQVEPIANLEEWDMMDEDEDDVDGICFVTLESWFENKERVRNW